MYPHSAGSERKIKMNYQAVTIWHNSYSSPDRAHVPMADGFEPGHNAMTPVLVYVRPGNSDQATARQLADQAFEAFNAPEDFLVSDLRELAAKYRGLHLRSLSVGDIVQVGQTYLACDHSGWSKLDWEDVKSMMVVPEAEAAKEPATRTAEVISGNSSLGKGVPALELRG
jgi:hypothetical protein